jgi:hypothetical protein
MNPDFRESPAMRQALQAARRPLIATGLASLLVLAACKPAPTPLAGASSQPAASVKTLAEHLRRNDLAGFARAAAPAEDLQALDQAWREGRSDWPLAELPLGERVPGLLATLTAHDAERQLSSTFDRQFARQERDLKAAARTLALFGSQYVQYQSDYPEPQRRYYVQVIDALGAWAQNAPLADATRAHLAVRTLVVGARDTGMGSAADLRQAGLLPALEKLTPLAVAFKSVFSSYGLDLDSSLDRLRTGLISEQGDTAQVEIRYPLGEREIVHMLQMKRRNGHWYPADVLAQAEAARQGMQAPEPETPAAEPGKDATAPDAKAPPAKASDKVARAAEP